MAARWDEIKALFHAAIDRPADDRAAFVAKACGEDHALRQEVERLLSADGRADGFLEQALAGATRSVARGTRLGPYEIDSLIGAGGMGEVYRARDTKLGRDVALKFLPRHLDQDPDRLRRFTNEARAASALNHPNILTIYEIGELDGVSFIAMELVDGKTLRARLQDGPLPLADALDLAVQVALALAAAHAKGIIHRDVKPENVMLRRDGYVKVLDFGLAQLQSPVTAARQSLLSAGAFETMATATGGTPAYMSPEQIDGAPADARHDIFAFGVLLCEVTTGTNPFARSSVLETLNAIAQTPDPALRVVAGLPPDVAGVIATALQKNPNDRYRTMADVLVALRQARRQAEQAARSGVPRSARRRRAIVAAALAVVGAALLVSLWKIASPPVSRPLPVQLTHFSTAVRDPAISPDGWLLAYIVHEPQGGDSQLFVQMLPDGQPQQLTHTPGRKTAPAFSPDGSRVAYTVTGDEWRWDTWVTSVVSGTPRLLLPNASSLQWLKDGRVLFSEFKSGAQLAVAAATESRSAQRDIYVPPLDGMAHFSDQSPDGRRIAIGEMRTNGTTVDNTPLSCFVTSIAEPGTIRQPVGTSDVPCSMFVRWSPDARWLYFASGHGSQFQIFRQPAEGGRPEQVTFGTGLAVLGAITAFALAPDGRSVIYPSGEAQETLWLRRADGSETQLTFEGNARIPMAVAAADGVRVFYVAGSRFAAGPMWMRTLDGRAEQICPGFLAMSVAPSPDGRRVVFTMRNDRGRPQLWVGVADNSSAPRRLTVGDKQEAGGHFGSRRLDDLLRGTAG